MRDLTRTELTMDPDQGISSIRPLVSRVTLGFKSDRGRDYLYDDMTASIFPWGPLWEAVLSAYLGGQLEQRLDDIQQRFGKEDSAAAVQFVRHWAETYGAFARKWQPPQAPPSGAEALEWVRRSCNQLILNVTEKCNLRCRYCAFSGIYKYFRVHSTRHMSPELARHAIDWFVQLISPQLHRNPQKLFGLSFYGGEPLLNAPTVQAALEYVQARYAGIFVPVLTTNAILLSEKNTEMLARHNVHLTISLDGPQAEHDRERVDIAGRGTYARVVENLNRARQSHPQYWREHFASIAVFSYRTDLEAVARFFEANEGTVPPVQMASAVYNLDTAFWQAATSEEMARFREGLHRMRELYKSRRIAGQEVGTFVGVVGGFDINRVVTRRRIDDPIIPCLPFTAACFPGTKIAVRVDGSLDICERVNSTFPIGRIGTSGDEGIDGERVRAMIEEYQRVILSACRECCVTRLCDMCFVQTLTAGGMTGRPDECARWRRIAERNLRDYVSIMEANPAADFSFETSEKVLDKRLLLQS